MQSFTFVLDLLNNYFGDDKVLKTFLAQVQSNMILFKCYLFSTLNNGCSCQPAKIQDPVI